MKLETEKKRKSVYVIVRILVRMVQIGVIAISFKMAGKNFTYLSAICEPPHDRYDISRMLGYASIPLCIGAAVLVFIDVQLYGLKQWMRTGMNGEELEQHVLSKTPPEVLKKAKTMEDDWKKLNEYLTSVQEEIGFSHDEMITLIALCHNMGKEYDRKRREEEDARAVKEIEAKLKREEEERARKEETEKYLKKYGLYKEEEKE